MSGNTPKPKPTGVDMQLLEFGLRLTPAQRLRWLEDTVAELSPWLGLARCAHQTSVDGAGTSELGDSRDAEGNRLDHLMGHWSEDDAREFEEATRGLDQIDDEMWK